jgi:hypothetical protein
VKTNLLQHWALDPEKLEAYVLHRLSDSEVTEFHTHIESCSDCRKIVKEEQELISGIRKYGRTMMKRRLKHQVLADRSRRLGWIQTASIAAALVLMFAAVFTIRWFVDLEQSKNRVREIILNEDNSSQQSLWIIGQVISKKKDYRSVLSKQKSSFYIKHGPITQTISINRGRYSDLPSSMQNGNRSIVRTLLKKTPNGLMLTYFSDSITDSLANNIEAITIDSLIVVFQNQQIAYHIPGGWGTE